MIKRELELRGGISRLLNLLDFDKVETLLRQHHVLISLFNVSGLNHFDQVAHLDIYIFLVQFLSIINAFLFDSFFHIKLGYNKVALRLVNDDSSFFASEEHKVLGVTVELSEIHALSFQCLA